MSPAAATDLPRRAWVAQIMSLPISIHLRGPAATSGEASDLVAEAFDDLRADEELFSIWRPDSPASRVRDGRDRIADAPPRLRQVAALCELAGHRTGGAFSAWLPDESGVLRFNPTGLVKGWAVQQASERLGERLRRLGAHDLMVNAGGDITVACTRTDTPDWVVAIEDPRDRSRMLRALHLRVGAVATSGTAARGAHIVDPATGAAADGLLSATVIGPELTWADVYATAAFVKGPAAVGWLAGLNRHAGLLVGLDGRITTVGAPSH
jgi:Membrane-associated lipoprotein involved in thiamine biosynthesis